MAKKKDVIKDSHTVRLTPDLWRELKHLAVDEKKTTSDLIEESIRVFLRDRKGAKP